MEKILVLEDRYRDQLTMLRTVKGLKAAALDDKIWLRGLLANDEATTMLKSLPVTAVYHADTDGRLFPNGRPTPVATLPVLDWQPLQNFAPVHLPVAALPGAMVKAKQVSLIRCSTMQPVKALLTDIRVWKNYALHAPATRLNVLRFALSASGQVMVIGTPLPQLPGKYYWQQDELLLPAGFDFDPPVAAGLIKMHLTDNADDIAVFEQDGSWQLLPSAAFRPAQRGLIRSISDPENYASGKI